MAGMAIIQLQTIESRISDPEEVAALTIGSVQAKMEKQTVPNPSFQIKELNKKRKEKYR